MKKKPVFTLVGTSPYQTSANASRRKMIQSKSTARMLKIYTLLHQGGHGDYNRKSLCFRSQQGRTWTRSSPLRGLWTVHWMDTRQQTSLSQTQTLTQTRSSRSPSRTCSTKMWNKNTKSQSQKRRSSRESTHIKGADHTSWLIVYVANGRREQAHELDA